MEAKLWNREELELYFNSKSKFFVAPILDLELIAPIPILQAQFHDAQLYDAKC